MIVAIIIAKRLHAGMARGIHNCKMNRGPNCVVRLICVLVMIMTIVLTQATQLQGKLKPCEC